jgi:hypothetical protein
MWKFKIYFYVVHFPRRLLNWRRMYYKCFPIFHFTIFTVERSQKVDKFVFGCDILLVQTKTEFTEQCHYTPWNMSLKSCNWFWRWTCRHHISIFSFFFMQKNAQKRLIILWATLYLLWKNCIILDRPLVVADFRFFSSDTLTGTNVASCFRIQERFTINVISGLKVWLQIHCNIKTDPQSTLFSA